MKQVRQDKLLHIFLLSYQQRIQEYKLSNMKKFDYQQNNSKGIK